MSEWQAQSDGTTFRRGDGIEVFRFYKRFRARKGRYYGDELEGPTRRVRSFKTAEAAMAAADKAWPLPPPGLVKGSCQ